MFDIAPPPEKRRLFSTITILLGLSAAILVALQYTGYALFPPDKTSTLWGILTGIVLMGLFVGTRWERAARRSDLSKGG